MKFMARSTARNCDSCGKGDSSADPCQPDKSRLWARYVADTTAETTAIVLLKTDGGTCWYCFRTWHGAYMGKYKSFADWKKAKRLDQALYDESSKFTLWLIEKIIAWIEEHGSRDELPNATWPSPAVLMHLDIYEVSWVMPDEEHEEFDDYFKVHGDPALKGDKVVYGPNGVKLVLLSRPRRWIKRRKIIQQAVKQQVMYAEGDDPFSAEMQGRQFDIMKQGIGGGEAASSSMPQVLPVQSKSTQPAVQPPSGRSPSPGPSGASPSPLDGKATQTTPVGKSPKAKGAAKQSGAKAKPRGRPPRDAAFLLRVSLKELANAGPGNTKFFGASWQTTRRTRILNKPQMFLFFEL